MKNKRNKHVPADVFSYSIDPFIGTEYHDLNISQRHHLHTLLYWGLSFHHMKLRGTSEHSKTMGRTGETYRD